MDVTKETVLESEQRLRGVLRCARITRQAGAWHFQEFATPEFDTAARRDALALVQNGSRWSQLVPMQPEDQRNEPLAVWSIEFASEEFNSGFIGWLASRIKERLGAGVLVVCGYDAARGGVYDHWACPLEVADAVQTLLERLQSPADGDDFDLDDRLMNAIATAEVGVIDEHTLFHFRQRGERVWARYEGGQIERGFLVGTVSGSDFHFRYAQVETSGKVDGGSSDCQLERLHDGRIQIREQFEWESRPGRGENLIAELPRQ